MNKLTAKDALLRLIFPLILGAVVLFLYADTFKGGFVYDDYDVVIKDPLVREFNILDKNVWNIWGRSIRTLSLSIDYQLFGDSPAGYHFQNILWHCLSVLMLYSIFVRLTADRTCSFVAALIFAVHPIHVEVLANISNRKESLCLFFLLVSFNYYIRFINENGSKKWLFFAASLFGWYIALNSKQVAIALPVFLMAYEYVFLSKERRFLAFNNLMPFGFAAAFIILFAYIIYTLDISGMMTLGGYRGNLTKSNVILASPLAFWTYIKLLLFPLNLSPDYVLELRDALEPYIVIAWIGALGAVFLAILLAKRKPLISLGLFWFLIHYIPVSNLIPSVYFISDRYMYIPSAGFCLVIASVWTTLLNALLSHSEKNLVKIQIVALLLILAVYSLRTVKYSSVWLNQKGLWDYTIKVTPKSYKAYFNRGVFNAKSGNYNDALKDLSRAIELSPTAAEAYYSRGTVFYSIGSYREAISDLSMSIKLKTKDYGKVYNNRGIAYKAIGEYSEAVKDFNKAVEFNPDDEYAYGNRGNAYYALGNYEKAINDFNRAILLNPSYVDAYNNRGYVYYILDKYWQSINDLNKAVEIDPGYANAYYNLGLVYSQAGNRELALFNFRKAAGLGSKKAQDYLSKSGLNSGK